MTEKSYKAMCEGKLEELDNLMSKLALLFSESLGRDKNSVLSKRHENQMYLIFYAYRMAEVTKRSIQFHIDCEDKKVTFLNRISIETDLVIEVCNVFFPIAAEEDSKPQLCKLIDNLSDNLNKQGVDLSDEEKAIVKIREYIDSKITKYLKLEEKHKWVSV